MPGSLQFYSIKKIIKTKDIIVFFNIIENVIDKSFRRAYSFQTFERYHEHLQACWNES